jgi:benzoylformate decarboxylase
MKAQKGYNSARSNHFIAMEVSQPAIDYLAMAQSMGLPGRRVERAADIAPAIEAGIASRQPNLIEVIIAAT